MNPLSQSPNAGSKYYPEGSPPPNGNMYRSSSNRMSNVPVQGQYAYPNGPYVPKISPAGFQPQNQNQNFQQNANFQQRPNVQQSQHPQPNPYQQQVPLPPQQTPPPQQVPQQTPPPQQATWRQFTVPTNSDAISSGFPFHPQLNNLQVKHDEWHEFTTEIVENAKLSASEDAAAWSAGVSAGAVSSAFLLVFGPPIGYYTGKAIHKKTVVKKVKERMLENGDIRAVLNKWNQRNFKWRGFLVWLECPNDGGETNPGTSRKDAKKFKLVVMPSSEVQEPFSAAPWSQAQPGLVEAPSAPPQRPVELHNTSAQNASLQNEPFKASYPAAVTAVPVAVELDAHDSASRPMPAELSG